MSSHDPVVKSSEQSALLKQVDFLLAIFQPFKCHHLLGRLISWNGRQVNYTWSGDMYTNSKRNTIILGHQYLTKYEYLVFRDRSRTFLMRDKPMNYIVKLS